MDVSTLFRDSVKTVHLRNKELGVANVDNPLKKTKPKSSFYIKVQTVVKQIVDLREFLLDTRSAYLNFSNYLCAPHMTDSQRDEIDTVVEKIMKNCSQFIKDLKREVATCEVSQQNIEHREIMLLLIENYLKNICKIYSEQKTIRMKRAIEIRRIIKLQPDCRSIEQPVTGEIKKSTLKKESSEIDCKNKHESNELSPMKIQEINGDVNTLMYEEELSPEDIQMFQSENEQLYNELNTITEEVKQIENKVVYIAELQEIFTEKVLDQDKDLDKLMTTVIGSTENVKEANEQIRQAIQRNAGMRVWILFFLLVMSFSLLFLDWYNP